MTSDAGSRRCGRGILAAMTDLERSLPTEAYGRRASAPEQRMALAFSALLGETGAR